MTAADSIVQRLRGGYAAFNDGNVSGMLEELDPEVEMSLGPTGKVTRLQGFTDLEQARAAFEASEPGL
jgi:hypothetical protein